MLPYTLQRVKFSVSEIQGSAVKNFVSLTLLLSLQFVNYILTSKANTLLFFVEKNNSVFVILPFEILTKIINFERLGPFCFDQVWLESHSTNFLKISFS